MRRAHELDLGGRALAAARRSSRPAPSRRARRDRRRRRRGRVRRRDGRPACRRVRRSTASRSRVLWHRVGRGQQVQRCKQLRASHRGRTAQDRVFVVQIDAQRRLNQCQVQPHEVGDVGRRAFVESERARRLRRRRGAALRMARAAFDLADVVGERCDLHYPQVANGRSRAAERPASMLGGDDRGCLEAVRPDGELVTQARTSHRHQAAVARKQPIEAARPAPRARAARAPGSPQTEQREHLARRSSARSESGDRPAIRARARESRSAVSPSAACTSSASTRAERIERLRATWVAEAVSLEFPAGDGDSPGCGLSESISGAVRTPALDRVLGSRCGAPVSSAALHMSSSKSRRPPAPSLRSGSSR